MEKIPDLHHVTAIASEPQRNLDFHNGPLRLRFVKRTVNFDDPRSYHFYFGDMVLLTPDTLPDLSSVRVWIGAGDQDPFVPASETKRLAELLRRAGADVPIGFAKAGHGLTNRDVEAARQWYGELEP